MSHEEHLCTKISYQYNHLFVYFDNPIFKYFLQLCIILIRVRLKKKRKHSNPEVFIKEKIINEHFINICKNTDCRLRKAGCIGFKGCPGYKS